VAKLTHVWVRCAACNERVSPNLVSASGDEDEQDVLHREGWCPTVVEGFRRWLCAVCALTPDESQVLVALRGPWWRT